MTEKLGKKFHFVVFAESRNRNWPQYFLMLNVDGNCIFVIKNGGTFIAFYFITVN